MDTTENIVSRGNTRIQFVDQYGEQRIIHRQNGNALRIKKRDDSISHLLNRAAAVIIATRIKARRLVLGLTLDELLNKAGLVAGEGQGKNRMWEIEAAGTNHSRRNAQGIRFGTLYALAIALECEPFDLMPTAKEVAVIAGVDLCEPKLSPRVVRKSNK